MDFFGIEIARQTVISTLAVTAVVALTLIGMRLASRLVRRSLSAAGNLPSTTILVNVTRVGILIVGALLVLAVLDISITPVLTALGVGGLAVALALQDTLGNLFAGLQLVASGQIKPGDYVLLESGQEGTVADVAWRTTTLRTAQDKLVIVPNSKLAQSIVTNYQPTDEPIAVTVEFSVAYDAELEQVEAVVADVAAEVMAEMQPELAGEPPVVRFRAFGDSAIGGVAIMRVPTFADQYPLRSAFIKRLHARFADRGIEFPFPTRTVHLTRD